MEASDFNVILHDSKCNIIYHKDTNTFNITNINNYIFLETLKNYNDTILNLSKKKKKQYQRPVKLDIIKECLKNKYTYHDMKRASVAFRGVYMSNMNDVKNIMSIYAYDYKKFLEYIISKFKETFVIYNAKHEDIMKIVNDITIQKINRMQDIIKFENITLTGSYILFLNRVIRKYNKCVKELITNSKMDPSSKSKHLIDVKSFENHLNVIKYYDFSVNVDLSASVDLSKIVDKYFVYHDTMYNLIEVNKDVSNKVNEYLEGKSYVYDYLASDDIIKLMDKDILNSDQLEHMFNEGKTHFTGLLTVVEDFQKIYDLQTRILDLMEKLEFNYNKIIDNRNQIEKLVGYNINVSITKYEQKYFSG